MPERAHVLSLFNDSPRAVGSASPARLHFRRQYRHPGAPALEIEVYDKGEEIIEWQKKADKKQAANQRVATNQRKPLNLSVGLKVILEDKQGNNTLPGEIVGVRSQRSCWVRMADSDRIFLRNRRFLVKDPAFNTQQLNMLRMKVENEGWGGESPVERSTAVEFSTSSPQKPALRSSGGATKVLRGCKFVTFADIAEAELGARQHQPAAAATQESNGGGRAVQLGAKLTFADVVKSNSCQPATAAAALQSNGGGGRFQPASKVTFAGVESSSGGPARHPGGRATGSLLLAPGGSAGSEQLAADPGRQEGAEVVALRREVAALREKIGRLESVLEGRL